MITVAQVVFAFDAIEQHWIHVQKYYVVDGVDLHQEDIDNLKWWLMEQCNKA